jgi:large subunit ribosomal protein L20
MARVKGGTISRARHKKVLKQAKGYFGSKHRLYRTANEQVMHSGKYAFRDRRQKKRDFRKLWITRINAGCRENDMSYSKFINGLLKANVSINRKMLSEIAINDKEAFAKLVEMAKKALDGTLKEEKVTVKAETKTTKSETKAETKKTATKAEKEEKPAAKKTTTKKVEKEEKPAAKKTTAKKETEKKPAAKKTTTAKKTTKKAE